MGQAFTSNLLGQFGDAFGGGLSGDLAKNVIMPGVNRMTGGASVSEIGSRLFDADYAPGYQQPPQGQMPQQPSQDSQQYFQQMRQNLDGLSEAFKQIEEMQMPGGQYQGDFGGSIMGRAGK
jgi:hypothetical protein